MGVDLRIVYSNGDEEWVKNVKGITVNYQFYEDGASQTNNIELIEISPNEFIEYTNNHNGSFAINNNVYNMAHVRRIFFTKLIDG